MSTAMIPAAIAPAGRPHQGLIPAFSDIIADT